VTENSAILAILDSCPPMVKLRAGGRTSRCDFGRRDHARATAEKCHDSS
jgi:hypothetical protein